MTDSDRADLARRYLSTLLPERRAEVELGYPADMIERLAIEWARIRRRLRERNETDGCGLWVMFPEEREVPAATEAERARHHVPTLISGNMREAKLYRQGTFPMLRCSLCGGTVRGGVGKIRRHVESCVLRGLNEEVEEQE